MATVDGWKISPSLGTSFYAAFSPIVKDRVMGNSVLFEDEFGSAMSAALENGLEVTAFHNNFFEQRRLFFMHVSGMGYPDKLATAIKKVLDAPEQVRSAQAPPAAKSI